MFCKDYSLRQNKISEQALKEQAKNHEQKARDVLEKVYFYGDSLGLAYDKSSNRYGFIDRELQEKIKFIYTQASSFDYTGYARVQRFDSTKMNYCLYLINTLGNEFALADALTELCSSFTAIDIRNQNLIALSDKFCKNTQLKVLLADGNRLKKLPTDFGNLNEIVSIDLGRNELQTVPASIGRLKSLTSLSFWGNQIDTLPDEFWQLKNLWELTLQGNKLAAISPLIKNLIQLEWLDLRNNKIKELPIESFKLLRELRYLDLRGNPLQPEDIAALRRDMPWCEIVWEE